jgi:hypothetical protein
MGEEFYCILKLISGEEIFSLISVDESNEDPIIILQNPVIIKIVESYEKSYIKIKPWVELSSDDIFIIKLDKIITMTESRDMKLIDVYNKYLMSDNDINSYNSSGKVNISNKMGYISSVEDARKKLENLYNGLKES